MYGFENFPTINASYHLPTQHETFNAFYWIFANASNANTSSFDNSTFVQPIVKTLLQSMPNGTYYNVSVHTPVPGLDSRGYYGGRNNLTLNAVVKSWLCHDNNAVALSGKRNLDWSLRMRNLGSVSTRRSSCLPERILSTTVRRRMVLVLIVCAVPYWLIVGVEILLGLQ